MNCELCGDPVHGGSVHPCCERWNAVQPGRPCPACVASKAAPPGRGQRSPARGISRVAVNTTWETIDGVRGLARRRQVRVTDSEPGKHLIDKGPTYPSPAANLTYQFLDTGDVRTCNESAFLRTYVPVAPAATVPPT